MGSCGLTAGREEVLRGEEGDQVAAAGLVGMEIETATRVCLKWQGDFFYRKGARMEGIWGFFDPPIAIVRSDRRGGLGLAV